MITVSFERRRWRQPYPTGKTVHMQVSVTVVCFDFFSVEALQIKYFSELAQYSVNRALHSLETISV